MKKISDKQKEKLKEIPGLQENDAKTYLEIWMERSKGKGYIMCECGCGELIYKPTKVNFHHILEKAKYPELRHEKSNILVITANCHNQEHLKPGKNRVIAEKTREAAGKNQRNRKVIKQETRPHTTTRKILFDKKSGKCLI